jgi:hypothetical protein
MITVFFEKLVYIAAGQFARYSRPFGCVWYEGGFPAEYAIVVEDNLEFVLINFYYFSFEACMDPSYL